MSDAREAWQLLGRALARRRRRCRPEPLKACFSRIAYNLKTASTGFTGMDVRDRNAFFVILGGVAAAGIVAAEVAHQSFTLPELLAGAAAVGVLFGAYVGLGRLRRGSWPRALATVDDTHVRYFRTVQDGDNWLIELTYSYRPAGGEVSPSIQGRSSLQFHGHGRELTDDIQASAKAGRRMVVEYDPAAPSRSRIVTNGEAPVFES